MKSGRRLEHFRATKDWTSDILIHNQKISLKVKIIVTSKRFMMRKRLIRIKWNIKESFVTVAEIAYVSQYVNCNMEHMSNKDCIMLLKHPRLNTENKQQNIQNYFCYSYVLNYSVS